jgi:hypothetical protein
MTNEALSLSITHYSDATQRNRICQDWNCDDVGVRQLTLPRLFVGAEGKLAKAQ